MTLSVWWWLQPRTVDVPGGDASFDYVVRYTGGAESGDDLPMIVALHGNGDSPANFFETALDGLGEPARVILLKGPRTMGLGGAAWSTRGQELRQCGDDVAAAVRILAREFATTGAPIVVGFSGGAIVAYYLAAAHPGQFSLAMPIAGLLPEDALDEAAATSASAVVVRAFHGTRDQVVGISAGRRATERLRSMWIDATLTELDGDHQAIFLNGRSAILDQLSAAVRAAGTLEVGSTPRSLPRTIPSPSPAR